MFLSRSLQRTALLLMVFVVPLASSAATVDEALSAGDDAVVSRGDFLRAAVNVLGFTPSREEPTGNYLRPVPRGFKPYVGAAEKRDALEIFGNDLGLGRNITRGEALVLLTKLQNLKPAARNVSFTDVKEGTDVEAAVRVAVEKGWAQPVRSTFFGVSRVLTGREARLILRKASGDTGGIQVEAPAAPRVPAITIQYKKADTVQLPENDLLRTVWQLLNNQYLHSENIDEQEAAYKAAEGLVNSLGDPYTTFMRPLDSRMFQEQFDGAVTGIGAQVEYKDDALTVVAPLSGSPAERAGVRAGDRILKVNGDSLSGLDLMRAVDMVRGPEGTNVTLTINRDGSEFDLTITRDVVRTPEIDISFQNNVAVIKIAQFGRTTDTQLRSLLLEVAERNPTGIVIDLRNNPGGLLHAAEIVVSNFLPQGSAVAVIKTKTEEYTEITSDPPTIDADVPVAVLINKGAASASEIVAGALQDHERAVVIGEKSFGKGTVQQIVEFRDGSSMKMTIAEWFTPKGRKINGVGVEPDVIVAPSETRDEQLLRAIDAVQ